jgi:hypothetical protein
MLKSNYQADDIIMTDKNMGGSIHKVLEFLQTERQKAHKFSCRITSSLAQI